MFHVSIPVVGELHAGSTMPFDLGVYCLVLGATLLILVALAHQSIRARRRTRAD
jgi:multicomponent K+:H+ antiporter subunit A